MNKRMNTKIPILLSTLLSLYTINPSIVQAEHIEENNSEQFSLENEGFSEEALKQDEGNDLTTVQEDNSHTEVIEENIIENETKTPESEEPDEVLVEDIEGDNEEEKKGT